MKYQASGEVERPKSRMISKGYNQRASFDYHETFSPVVKIMTITSIIFIIVSYGWPAHQVTGFVVKYGNSAISWKSKKQTIVSKSSAEAKYRTMSTVVSQFKKQTIVSKRFKEVECRTISTIVSELVWLIGLFKELGSEIELPTNLYSDSKAALQIAANPLYHEGKKHIKIYCHFIRENTIRIN